MIADDFIIVWELAISVYIIVWELAKNWTIICHLLIFRSFIMNYPYTQIVISVQGRIYRGGGVGVGRCTRWCIVLPDLENKDGEKGKMRVNLN